MSTADPSPPAETVRLYHLAREWEIPPTVLVDLLRSGGLEIESHFAPVQRDAIPELKATLARGRKTEAIAEETSNVEVVVLVAPESTNADSSDAEPTEEAPVAEPSAGEPAAVEPATPAEDGPKKSTRRRRRRRKKKPKTEATERPTRSLYGSGRMTWTASVSAKPRNDNGGVAPAVPSFGKTEVAPPNPVSRLVVPAPPADGPQRPPQEPSSGWSVPAFGSGAASRPSAPAPVAEAGAPAPATLDEPAAPVHATSAAETPTASAPAVGDESLHAPSRGWLVFLALGIAGLALAALLFALS